MLIAFGVCALNLDRRGLSRTGNALPSKFKAFTVLVHLLTHRHCTVSKEARLVVRWPGGCVIEMVLTRYMHLIHQAVGDDSERQ
jgi:hypothetical protein